MSTLPIPPEAVSQPQALRNLATNYEKDTGTLYANAVRKAADRIEELERILSDPEASGLVAIPAQVRADAAIALEDVEAILADDPDGPGSGAREINAAVLRFLARPTNRALAAVLEACGAIAKRGA
jgi:hypothetical protein